MPKPRLPLSPVRWRAAGAGHAVAVRWRLLLATLFLLWQMGGLLHALDHLSDGKRSDAPALPQHAACIQCLAHAGSDGALLVQSPLLLVAAVSCAPAPTLGSSLVSISPELPYQVRAPPLAVA